MTSKEAFQRYVPADAVNYCDSLFQKYQFDFKITRQRKSKLGDFKYFFNSGRKIISVNNNLNQYSFLITYLHEVAHLKVFVLFGSKRLPHGKEWQNEFKKLLVPVLTPEIFPRDVRVALASYLQRPKGGSCSDIVLYEVLNKYDEADGKFFLKTVPVGARFVYNGEKYKKIKVNRTRSICQKVENGKKYLIFELARVIPEKFQKSD